LFKAIKQPRATKEILSQLKDAVIRGQLKAGDKLPSERELTGNFQVSRGVVREAIRALEAIGYVTIKHGPAGGAYVNDFNFDRVTGIFLDLYLANRLTMPEVYQVRLHVEPEVARLAALKVNDQSRRRLREALEAERLPFGSINDRMQKLTRVHFILAEMCDNFLFEAMVNFMIKLTHRIVAALRPEDHDALHRAGEHDLIVEAVINGASKRAETAMLKHLQKFSKSLLDMDKVYHRLRLL
jgi:GntR family transcriptional repressor for pyruvate dehydrogenase complex